MTVLAPEPVAFDAPQEERLKSVETLRQCAECGQLTFFLTIGHVPLAWHEDDPMLPHFAALGQVVDAPADAMLYRHMRGRPRCTG